MRRFVVLGAIVALLFAMAAPASAGKMTKETVKEDISEEYTIDDACDFPINVKEDSKLTETTWFDSDGEEVKFRIKYGGTAEYTGPGGTAIEHFSWSGWDDGTTFRQAGNVFNVHMNGRVLHDKGLIVFGPPDGLIKVAGPHDVFFEGFDALCDAIG